MQEPGVMNSSDDFFYTNVSADFLSVPLGKENNFDKFGHGQIQDLGEPYDYGSIMHYGPKSFSRNGRSTIVGLKTGADQMGQRNELSANDIRQINKLYKCPNSKLDIKGEVKGLYLNAILDRTVANALNISLRFQLFKTAGISL